MAAIVNETARSDEELAAEIARRDASERTFRAARDAFEGPYRRHAPLLLAFLSSRVHASDRDDLHQDIWQRVWASLPAQFQGGNFRAWLHQIARNAIIDLGRKKRPMHLGDLGTLVDGRPDQARSLGLEQERKEALERCLKALKSELAALVRARLGGDSYTDICGRLGLRPEQAHKLFHQAKAQLKTCVEGALG
ncbi:MAG: RNA polymerase sigma factor [Isosphaeraceae bacterium]|jgi:RNA polymerase sigma factor (sigma-70 family)